MTNPPLYAWLIMLPSIVGILLLDVDLFPAPRVAGEFVPVNKAMMEFYKRQK